MKEYSFFYDETEHSRKINHSTISAENYYDNFIAVVVGWHTENEDKISKKYAAFEEKYSFRKSQGELKSTAIKPSQLKYGFASLNKDNLCLLEDLLSLFDEEIFIYFAVISKVEYLILQLFENYQNSSFFDMDALKYSIVKSLLLYQPKEIIEAIFENTAEFISLLKGFYKNKIVQNKANISLKQKENETFEQILVVLDDIHTVKTIDWNYDIAFFGFSRYLFEKRIENYSLIIDKEGDKGNTLRAAQRVGLVAVTEEDSIKSFGIRMADMLAGLISKLLKSLNCSLSYSSPDEHVQKKILEKNWFEINERQLNLYKKLYYVISVLQDAWYKSYAGIYADDLITFVSFLEFMNHFDSIKEIDECNKNTQGENFNTYVCDCLFEYFKRMRNKLPIEPIGRTSNEFFLNQRGARVYFNTNKQPLLEITNGKHVYEVLSVGFSKEMVPLITVAGTNEAMCYRLPIELLEWATTLVGLANMGIRKLPAKVVFTKTNDGYDAEIL